MSLEKIIKNFDKQIKETNPKVEEDIMEMETLKGKVFAKRKEGNKIECLIPLDMIETYFENNENELDDILFVEYIDLKEMDSDEIEINFFDYRDQRVKVKYNKEKGLCISLDPKVFE